MALQAGFLKNAVNPPGWVFACDTCPRTAVVQTAFIEHAIEAAKDAGWRQVGDHEYCPGCVQEREPVKIFLPEKCITGAV